MRLYERTSEPLVLEDEQEEEREEEEGLATGPETVTPATAHLNLASRKTVTAEKAVSSASHATNMVKDLISMQTDNTTFFIDIINSLFFSDSEHTVDYKLL